jgi:hypothetical protein
MLPTSERWQAPAVVGALLALAALAYGWWRWRRRPPLSATRAYERFRREVVRRDRTVVVSTPPLELARRAGQRHPAAAEAAERIVGLYVREAFGGVEIGDEEREALRADLKASVEVLKKAS